MPKLVFILYLFISTTDPTLIFNFNTHLLCLWKDLCRFPNFEVQQVWKQSPSSLGAKPSCSRAHRVFECELGVTQAYSFTEEPGAGLSEVL